ncbi:hypothetical protein D3C71_1899430 [compost metagenome]
MDKEQIRRHEQKGEFDGLRHSGQKGSKRRGQERSADLRLQILTGFLDDGEGYSRQGKHHNRV